MRQKTVLDKWNFAIGTTSRVPGSLFHYLMLDVDNIDKPFCCVKHIRKEFPYLNMRLVIQRTESGWHIYTDSQLGNLEAMLHIAKNYGADPVWCSIAAKRGYAFLADKSPVELPWPVERMVIGK